MNPTFTVSIDLEKRKTSAAGLVAVGEKVDVVISGVDVASIPEWEEGNDEGFFGPALRFRIVAPDGKDLVRYPLVEGDGWNIDGASLSAEVDFNTMQLRGWLHGFSINEKAEVGIIVDSVVDAMEYGRGTAKILQWTASPADDPTILPDWRKTLRDLNAAIVEVGSKADAATSAATIAETARDEAQAFRSNAESFANNAFSSANAAIGFKNEANSAAARAAQSEAGAAEAMSAAQAAKADAESARDEAKGYAESAESVLANAATKSELQSEITRAQNAEQSLAEGIVATDGIAKDAQGKANTLIGNDSGKSARTIAGEEVAKVLGDAPEAYDTLKEIADYITEDQTGAAAMAASIAEVKEVLPLKVDKVEGKGLSTKDYTAAEKDKLKGIEVGAQVNPDLTPYALKTEIPAPPDLSPYATKTSVTEGLRGKVDAEEGKGLSTEDYTTEEKTKLAGIEAGAQVNPDLTPYALKTEIPSVSGFATKTELEQGLSVKQNELSPDQLAAVNSGVTYEMVQAYWDTENNVENIESTLDSHREAIEYNAKEIAKNAEEIFANVIRASNAQATADEALSTATNAIPRYPFETVSITDGTLTLTPYACTVLYSDGTAFTVAMGGEAGKAARDCVLVVNCVLLETAPTIRWSELYHPRTDAATDFACVAGKVNVYWITEFDMGQYAVAGWQVTGGGNAEVTA